MAQTKSVTTTRTQLTYPSRYNVVIHNDDYTPIDFVIRLIVDVFNKNIDQAHALTYQIHENGKAIAGTFTKEVADQKVIEATTMSRSSGHPLKITAEEA